MNINFSILSKDHYLDVVQTIVERTFLFFLGAYTGLYLLEIAFPGFVLFAVNIQFLFYATLITGVFYVVTNSLTGGGVKKESVQTKLTIKDYITGATVGVIAFILSYNALNDLKKEKLLLSLLITLTTLLVVLYLRSEKLLINSNYKNTKTQNIEKWSKKITFLLYVIVLLYLGYWNLVPGGVLTYEIKPDHNNRNILEYDTGDDVIVGINANKVEYQLAIDSPVEISMRIPRRFNSASAEVTYIPTSSDTSVRLGTKNIFDGVSYTEIANYDPLLENLAPYWQKIRSGDLVLWQRNREYEKRYNQMNDEITKVGNSYNYEKERLQAEFSQGLSDEEYKLLLQEIENTYDKRLLEIQKEFEDAFDSFDKKYSSVEEFLGNIQLEYNNTLGYHFPLQDYFSIEGEKNNEEYVQNRSMRGSYTLIVYIEEESPLNVSIKAIDSNKHEGKDEVRVAIFDGSEKVIEEIYADDGVEAPTNSKSETKDIQLNTDSLEKGIYKILFETTYDIFTTDLKISTPYIAYQNKIHITDAREYNDVIGSDYSLPVVLYTNSDEIRFSTAHTGSLQTVYVNDQPYVLSTVQEWVSVGELSGITKVEIPLGDVKMRGDGLFSLDSDSEFLKYKEPTYNGIKEQDIDEANFIIANYPKPEKEGDWYVANGSVEAPHIGFNNNEAGILFDFGNLSLNSKTVKIKSIKVVLQKEPLTISRIIQKISDVFE